MSSYTLFPFTPSPVILSAAKNLLPPTTTSPLTVVPVQTWYPGAHVHPPHKRIGGLERPPITYFCFLVSLPLLSVPDYQDSGHDYCCQS